MAAAVVLGIAFIASVIVNVSSSKVDEARDAENTRTSRTAHSALDAVTVLSNQMAHFGRRSMSGEDVGKLLTALQGKHLSICFVSFGDHEASVLAEQVESVLRSSGSSLHVVSIGMIIPQVYGVNVYDKDSDKGILYQAFENANLKPTLLPYKTGPCSSFGSIAYDYSVEIGLKPIDN